MAGSSGMKRCRSFERRSSMSDQPTGAVFLSAWCEQSATPATVSGGDDRSDSLSSAPAYEKVMRAAAGVPHEPHREMNMA